MEQQFRIYAYLRASTKEQCADRAREQLQQFATGKGLTIAHWFVENESGRKLEQRGELFRLLDICLPGDVLLVEAVDRLSRLNAKDWQRLRSIIDTKQVRIVALDLPTSCELISTGDEFTQRIMQSFSRMMLEVLAAAASKDYTQRRERAAQGIKKRKESGEPMGRPANKVRNDKIKSLLAAGLSYRQIVNEVGCSVSTVSRVANSG